MAFVQRLEMSSEKLRQQSEGQLYKYTNVMKGWQYRWFILDPETGYLEYYLNETERKQKPRGSVHLAAAVISPSDEDSNTFTVNSANGEMFKLRAADARARQEWVNRIRAVAEMHTMAIAQSNPPLPPREHSVALPLPHGAVTVPGPSQGPRVHCSLAVLDAFSTVRDHLHRVEQYSFLLNRSIEELPSSGSCVKNIDEGMLLLKATSQATLVCLGHCLSILQQQQIAPTLTANAPIIAPPPTFHKVTQGTHPMPTKKISQPPSHSVHMEDVKKSVSQEPEASVQSYHPALSVLHESPDDMPAASGNRICYEDEISDDENGGDALAVPVEEHKSVILHLLSQLKLGMDLTRVVLPTFILERRSLLEMFADCMGHPDLFVRITDEPSPKERMMAMVEWYLTSFHMGRNGSVAKKPYNPIIGETFHCSWALPTSSSNDKDDNKDVRISYTAEQVSHHPPVTAFYVECPEKKMCVNASIWTKSNFSGVSVGVSMIGDISLYLGNHGERYDFTLPSAYARSIISVPWVELGGKVTINCAKTGYSANIIFHTKPFYGGKVHQVTAEVKNDGSSNICKIQGEWNSHFEFTYPHGESRRVDVNNLRIFQKRVRRLSEQGEFESRKLWYNVTQALQSGNITAATEYKRELEERQRLEERIRHEEGTSFPTVFFHKDDDNWVYNNMLVQL
ncbi:Oxysterol-binding protein [Gryllus bimaculatus]|nr:Oxysterol-binding protein [Gryllus bimaculatus]